MALTRPGAPAPTSSVSNAQALANRSVQNANRAGSTALQAASPSVPVEITGADGQHFTVSFGDVRNFICPKATDAECKIFLETCKQYHLNPFTKEAYLIHYDNKNEDTASTIVLGKNCYMQMAERHPSFDGFEAGVKEVSKWQRMKRSRLWCIWTGLMRWRSTRMPKSDS